MIRVCENSNNEQDMILSIFEKINFDSVDNELHKHKFKNDYSDAIKNEILDSIKKNKYISDGTYYRNVEDSILVYLYYENTYVDELFCFCLNIDYGYDNLSKRLQVDIYLCEFDENDKIIAECKIIECGYSVRDKSTYLQTNANLGGSIQTNWVN